ncbi:aspartate--ammonia ligase [Aequitasia blattaphilus]|uniref:Aspartate--ammonia ligase n=1 Tax=Aequitasia blattaphilus TaxID=2949332 RepID=A0ABT1EA51_9FIRM|nr:aspartate--ammonia ligase [Aequitasia blattaphilus]MCP1102715.1 aspartate--ammonia ligase [Aequitasia blattaphilus]MCR8615355.1 aspartate--ammonia ligase [Aequitasia blattaphilus]
MSKLTIPENYTSALDLYETQVAIGKLRTIFEEKLATAISLKRVSAPLFVNPSTGLNDDLNGVERPVSFELKETGETAQVVHSLAKWKRMALKEYDFYDGNGLYTDMNAIRRDEELSNIHSVYVDQWDWEKVITKEDRNMDFLKDTANRIVGAIYDTADEICRIYPALTNDLTREVKFLTTQELEDMYPDNSPKEREDLITKKYKTVFLMQIGDKLASGEKHDGRAPDYDDWSLNGDILFWNDLLGRAFEVSSMGIRVDEKALDEQLTKAGCDNRRELTFHKMLLNGELPLTIGGGIGQSRVCMLILKKAHIGEVQTSLWDKETKEKCKEAGIRLL